MKTILAPIDFSQVSERVINRAIELARGTSARLVLLHVVAPMPVIGRKLALTMTGAELAVAAEKEAAAELVKLQRSLRDRGVTAHAVHVCGDPRKCIIEQAERLTADYIVIGSHGHSAFYDLLIGSTASGVLKRASCPVVIVPPAARVMPAPPARVTGVAASVDV
jgi:nucleotide-binding universal stress UspA family protein